MVEYRSIHSRDTHFIAIIAYAVYDPTGNAPWREHTGRKFACERFKWAEAQHICTRNWLSRDAQHIANNTTHAGIGTTKPTTLASGPSSCKP